MSVQDNRISLDKGHTENGFPDKIYHIHQRYTGDNDELYFRDYLNESSDVAKEYETLKLRLWKPSCVARVVLFLAKMVCQNEYISCIIEKDNREEADQS